MIKLKKNPVFLSLRKSTMDLSAWVNVLFHLKFKTPQAVLPSSG